MNPQQPQTIGEQLVRALVGFPKFAAEWLIGLVIVVLSEAMVTTFAITGIAVGFAVGSALIGVAAFFVIYSLARLVDMLCRVIGQSTGQVVTAVYQTARQPTLPLAEELSLTSPGAVAASQSIPIP